MAYGPRIGEVAENRSGKFRFIRHVANAFLSVAKLQKKPMQKALAAYEDETFNLPKAPPFCQCDVSGSLQFPQFYFSFLMALLSINDFICVMATLLSWISLSLCDN